MRIEKLKKKYSFTEENLKKIQDAVALAEKTTDGEIALAITPSCSNYGFWELIFAVVMGLITSACLLPFHGKHANEYFYHVRAVPAHDIFITMY